MDDLVLQNHSKYATENINFKIINIIEDSLPLVDLVIVRDCFIHLSNTDVMNSIKNIKKSNSIYFATTTFVNEDIQNKDIKTGEFRFINLMKEPFNLMTPIALLNDNFDSKELNYKHKRLGVWEIA